MRIPQNASQRIKGGLHLFQLLFIFVAGCVTLAIYTKDGSNGGEVAYYFALVSCAVSQALSAHPLTSNRSAS